MYLIHNCFGGYDMKNIYSRPVRGVISDVANKPVTTSRSPGRLPRFRSFYASAGDEEMERCCQEATEIGDGIFRWSFCEDSHKD